MKEGERISLRGVWDGDEEARTVGEEIEALQRDKHALSQIAILVRAGFQTREFEERFITMGLPYRVIGGPRFYERQEIRDAMAYCRVTVQPDDDLAFERIYNTPRRGLGESALRTLRIIQRAQKVSLFEATRRALETDELKGRQRKSLGDLITSFDRWRAMLDGMNHVEVVETMLDELGYTDMLRVDRSPEAEGRLENLKELTNALQEFDTLPAFLEHVALLTDNAERAGSDMVSVMTLHAAKGLEFDTVFLPGWEEGLFPNQRALDDKGLAGLEEERRLAYVGLTRARKRAYVSFAANRRVFNQWQAAIPSRFLRELPTEQLAESSDAGLYATYSAGHHGGMREQASGFDYESLGVTSVGRSRTRWRDETFDDRRAVEGDKPDLSVGQRVFHQKFGYGRIVAVDGNKLDIEFEKAGAEEGLGQLHRGGLSVWTAWLEVPAADRASREQALEHLAEKGFVVTSREVSRDGPWRIEIFGEGDRTVGRARRSAPAGTGRSWPTATGWRRTSARSSRSPSVRSGSILRMTPDASRPACCRSGSMPAWRSAPARMRRRSGCLKMLATLDRGETVNAVDVGCGSGILAIAMAKLWQRPVIGGDNDAEAVEVARENAVLNGVGDLCRFVHAIGLRHDELQARAPYDLVVANILAGPLMELAESFSAAVRPGGRTLLSGLLLEQADDILAVYRRWGFAPERHIDLETGGALWRTLLLRRT